MEHRPLVLLERMWQRTEAARQDSDTAYFLDLLILAELTVKLVTVGMLAALVETRERHRYRLEYDLARANGIGDWSRALDDILVGPASQCLLNEASTDLQELTKRWNAAESSWQYEAVQLLEEACTSAGVELDTTPAKLTLRRWFNLLPLLRNRTRAHGAPTSARMSASCGPLESSIRLVTTNLATLQRPWVYLHRNNSGKYRVTSLGAPTTELDYLKRETKHSYADGVYVLFSEPRPLNLLQAEGIIEDFYIANGGYKAGTFEGLSYITDRTTRIDGKQYAVPPGALPPSETDARPTLEVRGNTFTDAPLVYPDYVARPVLERELSSALLDTERYPVVTLVGRGGIGKTSSTLKVLEQISDSGNFFASLWFSARDIDLTAAGPRTVQPQVLTIEEIARQLVTKLNPERRSTKDFRPVPYLTEVMADRSGSAPILLILDNFETVRNPSDVYTWLYNAVRLPNKILITTRFRDFKADFPVEVSGMTEPEFFALAKSTATRLGLSDLPDEKVTELYDECDGHPYVARIILGEFSIGDTRNVKRILASKEDILDALFERTFTMLNPGAQRVFLTLCNWRSHIPQIALEAALLRPANDRFDVGEAVEVLVRSSLVESTISGVDGQQWLHTPLAAHVFGKRKLAVSPQRIAIEADTEILLAFGAARGTDLAHGMEPAVHRIAARIRERARQGVAIPELADVMEYVARKYPRAWLQVAELSRQLGERSGLPSALEATKRYVEACPDDIEGWRTLATSYKFSGNYLGEINARLRHASMPEATYEAISDAASRFNTLLYERLLNLDTDEKRRLAEALRDLMVSRIVEANATDCSRLAWLFLHLGEPGSAEHYTDLGLEIDPHNQHCLKLKERLAQVPR